jgi:pyruvate formate lyase activating enzyme
LSSGTETVIRIPVIPGFNDSPRDHQGFSALLSSIGARTVHLLPFHQLGESKWINKPYAYSGVAGLNNKDVEPFARALKAAGFDVQVGG